MDSPNIGMICRVDNSGLGNLSWSFARNLKPDKILVIQNGVYQIFPERYEEFNHRMVPANKSMNHELQDWLLDGTDIILSFETFYNEAIVLNAKRKGVKTALMTMFEMTPEHLNFRPDLFICPSKLDYHLFEEPKVLLTVPIDTDQLEWNKRKKANVFIHNASHGGMNGRKGTGLFLEAIKMVKSDVKFIINSWFPIRCDDSRVEIRTRNYKNYWQIWREGDVLVYPQDYNGISLPIQEALASGLAIVSTDIFPFNEYLPRDLLFKPESFYKTRAAKGLVEVDAAKIDPKSIAEKIDFIANKDISEYSLYGKKWREENSWERLLPKYIKEFENLCSKK